MRDLQNIIGARALLFERLTGAQSEAQAEAQSRRILSRAALRESVRRELERLLNTRCPVPTQLLTEQERTAINYGIPDLSPFSPHSSRDQQRLAQAIEQTIRFYEPRLRQVQVTVEQFEESERALFIRIDAALVVETVTEPVSFPVYGRTGNGQWEIHECK